MITEQFPGSAFESIRFKKTWQKPLRSQDERNKGERGNDLWLLTLSDLLLLLVIFFVLLFGMAFQQQQKGSHSSPQAAAVQMESQENPIDRQAASTPDYASKGKLDSFEEDLRAVIGDKENREMLTVARQADNLILTFPERIVFDSGRAELKPSVRPILEKIGSLALDQSYLLLEVQGHTDDRPINTERYPSNWELSVGRATQVVKALIGLGLDPARISVRGFGEYRTRYPNDSNLNRSKNRRVEIQFSCASQP
jgi:chemotaxis protein MotB